MMVAQPEDRREATARPPGRPFDAARSRAIVEAAVEVLAEVGYRGFTMVKVAARAGASTATLYRRWSGKQELFFEAITLLARRAAGESDVGPFPEPPDTGDVVGDMMILVDRLVTLYTSREGDVFYGLIDELRHDPTLARAYREQFLDPPRAITEQTLRRGIARGQLTDIADLPLVAESCYGLVHTRALLTSEPLDHSFARRVVHAILSPYLSPSA